MEYNKDTEEEREAKEYFCEIKKKVVQKVQTKALNPYYSELEI